MSGTNAFGRHFVVVTKTKTTSFTNELPQECIQKRKVQRGCDKTFLSLFSVVL